MEKIWTVVQREYLTKVRGKVFLISTFLTPIGFALLMLIPMWSATNVEKEHYKVWVSDQSGVVFPFLKGNEFFEFERTDLKFSEQKELLGEKELAMNIPPTASKEFTDISFKVWASDRLSLQVQEKLKRSGNQALQGFRMKKREISEGDMDFIRGRPTYDFQGGEGDLSTEIASGVGFAMSMLIYMMLILYGTLIMRSVMEEKTNRIVELMVSSIRPIQLLLGKIIGVGLLGLTQFSLWIIMILGLTFGITLFFTPDPAAMQSMVEAQQGASSIDPQEIINSMEQIQQVFSLGNIALFLFYFLGGFFLYGSLFAAVGSAIDQESDAQSLTFPVILPLIIPMMVLSNIIQNPSGTLAVVFSQVPFFSPITMLLRTTTSDVPWYELLSSMTFLILGFLFCTWIAAKVYRVGILMYGKKASFKEMIRWVRHY